VKCCCAPRSSAPLLCEAVARSTRLPVSCKRWRRSQRAKTLASLNFSLMCCFVSFESVNLLCFLQRKSKHSKLTYLRKRRYASWFKTIFNQLAHNLTTTGFKASMKPRNNRICCSIYNKIETG